MRPVSSAMGMNSQRRDQPALGMAPAHQRLEPGAARPSASVDDRLVVQDELAPLDRAAQLVLQRSSRHRVGVHRGVEDSWRAVPARLRAVHRRVGVAQHVFRAGVAAPGVARCRCWRWRRPRCPCRPNGTASAIWIALRDPGRLPGVADVLEQHGELVAAEPRDGVAGAQAGLEPPRDRHQQLVARGVAEAVVDDLEAVEVEEERRRRR